MYLKNKSLATFFSPTIAGCLFVYQSQLFCRKKLILDCKGHLDLDCFIASTFCCISCLVLLKATTIMLLPLISFSYFASTFLSLFHTGAIFIMSLFLFSSTSTSPFLFPVLTEMIPIVHLAFKTRTIFQKARSRGKHFLTVCVSKS